MGLDFIDNFDNVISSTVREVEQAPTMNNMVPAAQCATVLTRVPLPLQGPTVSADARPGHCLPPGTKAPITMKGPAFLPMASAPILLIGGLEAQSAAMPPVAPMQSAAMLPMAGALLLSQCTPYPSAYMYMAPTTLPMYMPSYPTRPQMKQSSTQSERELLAMQRQELEARELEVERRTRALNLNAIRDAETRSAAPSVRSSRDM